MLAKVIPVMIASDCSMTDSEQRTGLMWQGVSAARVTFLIRGKACDCFEVLLSVAMGSWLTSIVGCAKETEWLAQAISVTYSVMGAGMATLIACCSTFLNNSRRALLTSA